MQYFEKGGGWDVGGEEVLGGAGRGWVWGWDGWGHCVGGGIVVMGRREVGCAVVRLEWVGWG